MEEYNLHLGISNACFVILFVSLFLGTSNTTFVHFGPSPSIVFAGYTIDTWERWTAVMMFSIISQISICVNVNTLEPFITNVVRDHKSLRVLSAPKSHAIVQVKTAYDWILGILNTNLWVTLQVQFLLTGLLTDMLVTGIMTQRFLNSKKKDPLLFNSTYRR